MRLWVTLCLCLAAFVGFAQTKPLSILSQKDYESKLAARVVEKLAKRAGAVTVVSNPVDNDRAVYNAVINGSADVGVVNLDSFARNVLNIRSGSIGDVNAALKGFKLAVSQPLGYDRGWGIAIPQLSSMTADGDQSEQITSVNQLTDYVQMRIGFDFSAADIAKRAFANYKIKLNRTFAFKDAQQKFRSLDASDINCAMVRRTDPEIDRRTLLVLNDSLKAFDSVEGVLIYRTDIDPKYVDAFSKTIGLLDNGTVRKMVDATQKSGNIEKGLAVYFRDYEARRAEQDKQEVRLARQERHAKASTLSLLWEKWTSNLDFLEALTPLFQHLGWVLGCFTVICILGWMIGVLSLKMPFVGAVLRDGLKFFHVVPAIIFLGGLISVLHSSQSAYALWAVMVVGGLYPVVVAFVASRTRITKGIREAAIALGLDEKQQFRKIYFPLTSQLTIRALRLVALYLVTVAIFAGLYKGGGLGTLIFQGFISQNMGQVRLGVFQLFLMVMVILLIFKVLEQKWVPKLLRDRSEPF